MADEQIKRCAATTKAGKPCPNGALPGSDYCAIHGLTPERRREIARVGGRARGRQMQLAARADGQPCPTPEQVEKAGRIIGRLLDSTLPWGEPNILEQALGVFLLAKVFRFKPDQRRELIRVVQQARPYLLDKHASLLLELRNAQSELKRLLADGRISLEEMPAGWDLDLPK